MLDEVEEMEEMEIFLKSNFFATIKINIPIQILDKTAIK